MHRRRFLTLFGLGSAAIALEQAIPFGRVWSFPKKIVLPFGLLDGAATAHELEQFEASIPAFFQNDAMLFEKLARKPDFWEKPFAPRISSRKMRMPVNVSKANFYLETL